MNLPNVLFLLTFTVYLAAFGVYLKVFLGTGRVHRASYFMEAGFLLHTLYVFSGTFNRPEGAVAHLYLPVATVGEASSFFAWSLAFVYLILVRGFKTESFGLVLSPALLLFLIPAFFPFQPSTALQKHFDNTYFLIHILTAFFGYASFALSFIAGVLYLAQDRALKRKTSWNIQHKLPPLEDLEHLIFRTVLWGVLLLGFAIASGVLWAKSAFGSFILKEPKALASLLTWCAYLGIIYLHKGARMKGKRLVRISVVAFVLVLLTFWGTGFVPRGLHVGIWST